MTDDAYQAADQTVALLKKAGYEVTAHDRELMAQDLFDDGLLEGNWDSCVQIGSGKTVRCINEDEYEQHMDDADDRPEWDDMIGSTSLGYIWVTE